jgi:ribosome-associated heat shock protein Hsp15
MSVRIDKWLWAARFFKTRSLASKACELGRIRLNHQLAKPAREVKIGDLLRAETPGGVFEMEVLALREARGPASEAQKLYRELEESKAARMQATAERKAMAEWERLDPGRPDKRDRREIRRRRGRD